MFNRSKLSLILVAVAFASLLALSAAAEPPASQPFSIGRISDVTYATVDGVPLQLDVYLPADDGAARPMVLFIHGGSWLEGDKAEHPELFLPLAETGYIVCSINYRLTDVAPYPAQIEDCKAAVRWVREHAAEYGGDPTRIAAVGESAGAHLAALLGTSGDVPELEGGAGDGAVSSRVQAVVDWYGPSDLSLVQAAEGVDITPVIQLLGGTPQDRIDMARLASPTTFVSPDDPPFLIIHGTDDPRVPFAFSQLLAGTLAKAGVSAELIPVPGGLHGGFEETSPNLDELMVNVVAFLDRVLD